LPAIREITGSVERSPEEALFDAGAGKRAFLVGVAAADVDERAAVR